MPRKKKEEELTNIDLITKKILSEMKSIKSAVKLDGITIECEIKPKSDMKVVYDDIRDLCSRLKLNPISLELNKTRDNTFIIQFPDYENKFSEEEKYKLYKDYFKFLVDSLYRNDHDKKVTREVVEKSRDLAIEQSLNIYFRSYANQYKETLQDISNDPKLKYKMQTLYQEFLNEYYLDKE